MPPLFGRYPRQQLSHTVAIMSRTRQHPSHPFNRRAAPPSLFGALEWQELPSLAPSLQRRDFSLSGSVRAETQRMELFDLGDAPPAPFAEPIHGLHVREIDGADVFSHFFGHVAMSH